jgi:hypothetical protein
MPLPRASPIAFLAIVALVATPVAVAGVPVASGDAAGSGLHGNHVSIDAQVSADGTVVAETAASLTSAFLVVHADDGGTPGDPIGHTYLNGTAFRPDVSVTLDDGTWADWSGNRTLWAVIHLDDGDGEFDPATDRSAAMRNPAARQSFVLGSGEHATHVLARQFDPLPVREGAVTVRRVSLADEGYVVAKPVGGDRILGSRHLAAGSHTNVSLPLNASYLADRNGTFRLRFVAYRDDGDGEFGDGDRPVRVAGTPVGTDAIATVVSGPQNVTTRPLVVTPSASPTADPTPAGTTAGGAATPPSTAASTGSTAGSGPGFGGAVALLVVTLAGAHAARRRL